MTRPPTEMQPALLQIFLEEIDGHLRAFNADLLAVDKSPQPNRDLIKTLFRTAHSLKGAARSVNELTIEGICHHLEEVLGQLRDDRLQWTPALLALLYDTADALAEAAQRLQHPGGPRPTKVVEVTTRLKAALVPSAAIEMATFVVITNEAAEPARRVPTQPAVPVTEAPTVALSAAPKVPESAAPTVPVTTAPAKSPPQAPPTPLPQLPAIRMAPEKLNVLLAQSGELLGALWRVQTWTDELVQLQDDTAQQRIRWQRSRLTSPLLSSPRVTGAVIGPPPAAGTAPLDAVDASFQRLEQRLDVLARGMTTDWRRLNAVARTIDQEVHRIRMLPFADTCDGLERLSRDLAHRSGKKVRLQILGGDVALDRSVHDALKDPLRHLLRNAIDHGVETPEVRLAAGKLAEATITIQAVLLSSHVEVTVADDGRGLDLGALRAQLVKRGLPVPLDDGELARTVYLPGLSTAAMITDVSGRGVGLDVVKGQIEALHGSVHLHSQPGRGCRFGLSVPLTLTTLQALLVKAGGQTFAFAGTNVCKLLRLGQADVHVLEGRQVVIDAGQPLPLVGLAAVLGLRGTLLHAQDRASAVIIEAGELKAALIVDELVVEREVVVKHLGARIKRLRYVSGATILPSGAVALVLNAAHVLRHALSLPTSGTSMAKDAAPKRKRIIIAEDSVTTRTLEKTLLESAGYEVLAAADGEAAWALLQEHGADLLVSDVEMPRLDGFELARSVRRSPRFQHLPIVLLTALESNEHRALGIEIGADAYLVKQAFDQVNLLTTIAQLL